MEKTTRYSLSDIMEMESFFRRYFMNTVTGYKSASLIGTQSPVGHTNLAIFNSVVHIGATPPCMGFVMRPVTVERHTYDNIKSTGFFTINQVHEGIYRQAHQTSARYPADTSEFTACGLTPQHTEGIGAPYVAESHVKFGLAFEEEHHIKANGTLLVVGKVLEITLPNSLVADDGFVDLEKAKTVAITGLDTYHLPRTLARLSYAKPDKPLATLATDSKGEK